MRRESSRVAVDRVRPWRRVIMPYRQYAVYCLGADAGTSNALTGTILKVVEDTPTEWHVFVCTLCSCYPLTILGLPPHWYKVRRQGDERLDQQHSSAYSAVFHARSLLWAREPAC